MKKFRVRLARVVFEKIISKTQHHAIRSKIHQSHNHNRKISSRSAEKYVLNADHSSKIEVTVVYRKGTYRMALDIRLGDASVPELKRLVNSLLRTVSPIYLIDIIDWSGVSLIELEVDGRRENSVMGVKIGQKSNALPLLKPLIVQLHKNYATAQISSIDDAKDKFRISIRSKNKGAAFKYRDSIEIFRKIRLFKYDPEKIGKTADKQYRYIPWATPYLHTWKKATQPIREMKKHIDLAQSRARQTQN